MDKAWRQDRLPQPVAAILGLRSGADVNKESAQLDVDSGEAAVCSLCSHLSHLYARFWMGGFITESSFTLFKIHQKCPDFVCGRIFPGIPICVDI